MPNPFHDASGQFTHASGAVGGTNSHGGHGGGHGRFTARVHDDSVDVLHESHHETHEQARAAIDQFAGANGNVRDYQGSTHQGTQLLNERGDILDAAELSWGNKIPMGSYSIEAKSPMASISDKQYAAFGMVKRRTGDA